MDHELNALRLAYAEQDCPHGRKLAGDFGDPTDAEINAAAETSYRRGFDQGVAAAIAAVEAGASLPRLTAWKRRLGNWRRKRHHGRIEYPEWLDMGD